MCPHLDTWNRQGIKGPNRTDSLIVRFPAGSASQRGGTCSILVDASYERERERSYSFMAAGQFLVNERFSRSSDRDSAVSGTRAFFLFPRPRWLKLEPQAHGGVVTVRLDPVRVVEIGSTGFIRRMTGAVLEEASAVTATTQGGVVFKRFEGVVLDAGWGRGEVAFQKFPDGESTFTDRGGRTCTRSQPADLQLRGPVPPGAGLRERPRAGPVPRGAVRTGVRRRPAPRRTPARRRLRARAAEPGPAPAAAAPAAR